MNKKTTQFKYKVGDKVEIIKKEIEIDAGRLNYIVLTLKKWLKYKNIKNNLFKVVESYEAIGGNNYLIRNIKNNFEEWFFEHEIKLNTKYFKKINYQFLQDE